MAEGRYQRADDTFNLLAAATIDAYQVIQLPSGEAAFLDSPIPVASGTYTDKLRTRGKATLAKVTSVVLLPGQEVYWDHSANSVTYKRVNDRDFFVGTVVSDVTAAATTVDVDLNKRQRFTVDALRDPCLSGLNGTPAAGGFGYPVMLGGRAVLELTATSEAQRVDLMTVDGFDLTANPIVEAVFVVMSDGSNATQDFTIGVASGTHATDFQSVTSFVAVSTVGNSVNINVQSDDNSTDVPPTDSTLDYTEGSAVANRVHVLMDFRDPADVQVYVNGALVLGSTTFSAGLSGTHFLIAHLEKTSGTDVYKVGVDALRAWTSEQ